MISSWGFEFYNSATFWGALLVVVIVVRLVGTNPHVKGLALAALSSAMILAIPRFGVRGLVVVWAFAGVTFAVVRELCRPGDDKRRRWIATFGIVAVLLFLCVFKYRLIHDAVIGRSTATGSNILLLIGVSYFSFKAIHTMVETYRRTIPTIDPLAYLNYIIFFPAFVSGPISRYPQFAAQMGPVERGTFRRDLALGGARIVHGLFKKIVLVKLLFPHILGQGKALGDLGAGQVVLGLYVYAIYFYVDFAGYTDLAIGSARLLGMELPENFKHPFMQRNIRDLWSGWHMSLTNWLIDYVYWPLVRKLRHVEFFRPRPLLLSIVGMNATFLACGAWHGESLHFCFGASITAWASRCCRSISDTSARSASAGCSVTSSPR